MPFLFCWLDQSLGGKLALLDHSSRLTCGSFALVAWYSPYKRRQNRQLGIGNFMMINSDLDARPIEKQRTQKNAAGAKNVLWHLHQNRFRPSCDSPVRASQGQSFAMISPQNLERQAQTTLNHRALPAVFQGSQRPDCQNLNAFFS